MDHSDLQFLTAMSIYSSWWNSAGKLNQRYLFILTPCTLKYSFQEWITSKLFWGNTVWLMLANSIAIVLTWHFCYATNSRIDPLYLTSFSHAKSSSQQEYFCPLLIAGETKLQKDLVHSGQERYENQNNSSLDFWAHLQILMLMTNGKNFKSIGGDEIRKPALWLWIYTWHWCLFLKWWLLMILDTYVLSANNMMALY